MIGYLVWPIYGYDGPITDRIRAEMPERLRAFETIQDLLSDDEGKAWWWNKGRAIKLTFDLDEGSESRWLWSHYWNRKPRTKIDP